MKRAAVAVALFVLSSSWFLGCDTPPGDTPPSGSTRPPSEKRKAESAARSATICPPAEKKTDRADSSDAPARPRDQ